MGEQECFTCGSKRQIETFRYVVEDKGVSGSTYYACNTQCLSPSPHPSGGSAATTTTWSRRNNMEGPLVRWRRTAERQKWQ